MFVIRATLPANYRIPAHSHSTDEVITVVSGTLMVGMGDKLVPANAKPFPAGSLIVAPAKANHFVLTKQPAVIEVSAMGPLQLTHVSRARRLRRQGGKASWTAGWLLPPCRPWPDVAPDVPGKGRGQPRPTNGILVAMMVRNSTFASSGRLAM